MPSNPNPSTPPSSPLNPRPYRRTRQKTTSLPSPNRLPIPLTSNDSKPKLTTQTPQHATQTQAHPSSRPAPPPLAPRPPDPQAHRPQRGSGRWESNRTLRGRAWRGCLAGRGGCLGWCCGLGGLRCVLKWGAWVRGRDWSSALPAR